MATTLPTHRPRPPIPARLLAGLRWRIRLYVWLEGLALAVIWLGLMFWISLGLDYLPVLVGASEMPAVARGVLLVGTAAVLAWLLYQFVLRRAFVRLADRSMALLLERKFTGFHDSLVTAVEMAKRARSRLALQPRSARQDLRRSVRGGRRRALWPGDELRPAQPAAGGGDRAGRFGGRVLGRQHRGLCHRRQSAVSAQRRVLAAQRQDRGGRESKSSARPPPARKPPARSPCRLQAAW